MVVSDNLEGFHPNSMLKDLEKLNDRAAPVSPLISPSYSEISLPALQPNASSLPQNNNENGPTGYGRRNRYGTRCNIQEKKQSLSFQRRCNNIQRQERSKYLATASTVVPRGAFGRAFVNRNTVQQRLQELDLPQHLRCHQFLNFPPEDEIEEEEEEEIDLSRASMDKAERKSFQLSSSRFLGAKVGVMAGEGLTPWAREFREWIFTTTEAGISEHEYIQHPVACKFFYFLDLHSALISFFSLSHVFDAFELILMTLCFYRYFRHF